MSKDQYVVHDDPTMEPKTVSISITYKNSKVIGHFPNIKYWDFGSAREYVEGFVQGINGEDKHVDSVEYWVNVKADK